MVHIAYLLDRHQYPRLTMRCQTDSGACIIAYPPDYATADALAESFNRMLTRFGQCKSAAEAREIERRLASAPDARP